MKSILIDPYTRTVSEIERKADLQSIYDAIGTDELDFRRLDGGHVFVVDDVGLLTPGLPCFWLGAYPDVLAGKCLISGVDDEGNDVDVRLTVSRVEALVRWTTLETTGELEPTTSYFDTSRNAHVTLVGRGILRERKPT